MEINTYTLRKNNDEFSDLTENQLMAIANLCMDYYKKGESDVKDDCAWDYENTITELECRVDELESQIDEAKVEYDKLMRENEELKEKYEELKNDNNPK